MSGQNTHFVQAQFVDFAADPRVIAAMQNWDKEEAMLRRRLQSFLVDLSSAS